MGFEYDNKCWTKILRGGIIILGGISALAVSSIISREEALRRAYNVADKNHNRILEPEELRDMALQLGVIRENHAYTPRELESKIANSPWISELNKYAGLNEYGGKDQ